MASAPRRALPSGIRTGAAAGLPSSELAGYAAGVGLALLLIVVAFFVTWTRHIGSGDFASYFRMWEMVLEGRNPYAPGAYCAFVESRGFLGCAGAPGPPPTMLVLAPVALLPLSVAWAVWAAAGATAAACGVFFLLRRYGVSGWLTYYLVGLAVFVCDGTAVALAIGQWGPWFLGGFALLVAGVWPAGAIAAIKPHIFLVPALAGSLRMTHTMRAALAAATLLFVVATWPLWQDWLSGLLAAPWTARGTASIWRALGVLPAAAVGVGLAAVVAASAPRSLAAWTTLGLVLAPYARVYDYPLLFGPLIIATARWRFGPAAAAVGLAIAMQVLAFRARLLGTDEPAGARDELATIALPLAVLAVVFLDRLQDRAHANAAKVTRLRSSRKPPV